MTGHVVRIVSLGELPLVQRLEQEIDDAGRVRTGRDCARHGKADLVDILVVSHVILRYTDCRNTLSRRHCEPTQR